MSGVANCYNRIVSSESYFQFVSLESQVLQTARTVLCHRSLLFNLCHLSVRCCELLEPCYVIGVWYAASTTTTTTTSTTTTRFREHSHPPESQGIRQGQKPPPSTTIKDGELYRLVKRKGNVNACIDCGSKNLKTTEEYVYSRGSRGLGTQYKWRQYRCVTKRNTRFQSTLIDAGVYILTKR